MRRGISKKAFTYVALIGVLVLALMYFFVYKKYIDLTEATKASNKTLKKEVEELKVHYDNEPQYLADMVPLKEEIVSVLEKYPADSREEDVIMQAVRTQLLTPVFYSNVNIGQKSVLKTVTAEVVQAAAQEEYQEAISFVEQEASYVNQLTYESLKEVVQAVFDSDYNIGIRGITYSKAGEEDDLSGTLDLSFYSVKGTGKEYEIPNILPYLSGTDNIFGISAEVEE